MVVNTEDVFSRADNDALVHTDFFPTTFKVVNIELLISRRERVTSFRSGFVNVLLHGK